MVAVKLLTVDYIRFLSFEIRGYILNNQKILICSDFCSRSSLFILWTPFDTYQSFAVAGDVFDDVFLCYPFPTRCLG